MKTTLILNLIALFLTTLIAAAQPAPRLSQVRWKDTSNRVNNREAAIIIQGANLADASACAFTKDDKSYPLELVSIGVDRIEAKLPLAAVRGVYIPPGHYHVTVTAAGREARTNNASVHVEGLTIPTNFWNRASAQQQVKLQLSNPMYLRGVARVSLYDKDGQEWKHRTLGNSVVEWDPVPVGQYDVVFFASDGRLMWKSPDKFRVFANPTR